MKKVLLLFLFISSQFLNAQDTTIIQTLTFDSTGRSYVFDFPPDDGTSYQKILMEYRIRCKDALVSNGSNTNLGCGEWDYSCNTYIIDSSFTDSVKAVQGSYVISGFSGTSFDYTSLPTYTYYQSTQQEVLYSDTTSESIAELGTGVISSGFPFDNSTGQAKVQYLIEADELITGGLSAGDITGMRVSLDQLGEELTNLRVKLKETSQTALDSASPDLDGFSTVYYLNTSFQTSGMKQFNFSSPFDWDGSSNLIVEFSFDQSAGVSSTVLAEANAEHGIASTDSDYSIVFNGIETIAVENAFEEVQNEISIVFWAFGNAEELPSPTMLVYGIDTEERRQVNIHLPWENDRIYWDCGNDGTGYDRIEKLTIPEEFEGRWNHWAFTKNANTGTMKIYYNGSLWHSGTGKTNAIDVQELFIGTNNNGENGYYGKIDEFSIWNTELNSSEINDLMYSSVNETNPNYANLIAYYTFDQGSGNELIDETGNHPAELINSPLFRLKSGQDLNMNFVTLDERPNMDIIQGEYTSTVTDYVQLDSLINAPNSVQAYSLDGTDLVLDSLFYSYEAGEMPVYDEDNNEISSVTIPAEGTLDIVDLNYYRKDPSQFEIMSFVTPYGINLDLGVEGKMWQFDVTDFEPILHDAKQLSVEFGKYQEEMDIRFLYISGTPSREVKKIQQVWRAGVQRSYQAILSNAVFEPRDVLLDPLASGFKLRAAITGHGQEGEFIPRTHYIDIDGGANEFSWQVWKECADNPIFPQGGTWIYDRAGWCPGAPTDLEEFAITNDPGETIEVDYGINSASGDSRYLVNVQLVTYGEANFDLDAGIVEVKQPSNRVEYDRINPICNDPVISIQNTGSTTLTSLVITYEVSGGVSEEYTWTGSLDFLEKEDVTLPISDQSFWAGNGGNVFSVTLSSPNGGSDEYAGNNSYSSPFQLTDVYDSPIYIKLKTNNLAYQNSYTVKDENGNVVYSLDDLENGTIYRDTLNLPAGCYTFEMEDSGDNGLYFWAEPSQGNGYLRIYDVASGSSLITFEREFGKSVIYSFTYGTAVNVSEMDMESQFEVYPNPNNGQFLIDMELAERSDAELIIYDLSGREIQRKQLAAVRDASVSFDLSAEPNGVYYCTLQSNDTRITKKIVLNR